jgi:hypothetical protein
MNFKSQAFTIADLYNWYRAGELILQPRFQRRKVWSRAARSYLIDTIGRGYPVPKIYYRMTIDVEEVRSVREVVDGQQRLSAVFDYLDSEFPVFRAHSPTLGGQTFSSLDPELRDQLLSYEFSADLLIGATDAEVLQVFARINTYTVTLNAQEKRNARFVGAFKTAIYDLATEHLEFWRTNRILTEQYILRMAEAELTSELVIGLLAGLQDKKGSLDDFYRRYEEDFPQEILARTRFEDVMSWLDTYLTDSIRTTAFRRRALFYSLYMAVADALHGIPKGQGPLEGLGKHATSRKVSVRLDGALRDLSRAVADKEPPARLVRFARASAQQTDNIGPRSVRHKHLVGLIAKSMAS